MDFDELLTHYQDRIINKITIPARKAKMVDIPNRCNPNIKKCLAKLKFTKLYTHQSEMIDLAISGENVIITTGTSSGKSLAFYLPVIQRIIENPNSRSLFIYPTKALAQDQLNSLNNILKNLPFKDVKTGIYDGDTPQSERKKIREQANIILTNPDMLNAGFLPFHNQYNFQQLFENLTYVIIDELHTYRSAFGSHVSNLMRRLNRVCQFHGSSPQYLCSSATIANPVELAENICHVKFSHIDNDGSPSVEKLLYYWLPPSQWPIKEITQEISEIVPSLIENDFSGIVFCRSRRDTEIVTKEIRDTLIYDDNINTLSRKISGYRGGYTPEERRKIELDLRNGTIKAVVSTNALELGIDIGSLEYVIVGGFPGTRASFWQQAGRVGRRGNKAHIILLLDNNPIDLYIKENPEWLIKASVENAIVDKDNIIIQLAHVRAAAAEIPLSVHDASWFPDLGEIIPLLVEYKELEMYNKEFHWVGKAIPSSEISLRSITNQNVEIVNNRDKRTITTMELTNAKYELYPGAIYIHNSIQYKCLEFNIDAKTVFVEPVRSDHYTVPWIDSQISIISKLGEKAYNRVQVRWGDVNVFTSLVGFKKIRYFTRENIGFDGDQVTLENSIEDSLDTEGCWIELPDNLYVIANQLSKSDIKSRNSSNLYETEGIAFALRNASGIRVMASYGDIRAVPFNVDRNDECIPAIILYDLYPGGLGFAQKIFQNIVDIVEDAIQTVSKCKCKTGCPICVGSGRINKKIVLWALKNFISESPMPKVKKYVGNVIPRKPLVKDREFKLEELVSKWNEILIRLRHHNLEAFPLLERMTSVKVNKKSLLITSQSSTYLFNSKMLDKIEEALLSTMRIYVQIPDDFSISFKIVDDSESSQKRAKLQRYIAKKNRQQ